MGLTRYDYRCQQCQGIQEVKAHLGEEMPQVRCPRCGGPTIRYFGATSPEDISINYGFRPHRYAEKTDRDIAQYQFEHL